MSKIVYRPEEYTISVRHELVEDDWLYVARVEEIPDIVEYADDANFARNLALDSISTFQELASEHGISVPLPKEPVYQEYSGRVTLRLKKSIHAKAALNAEKEGVSLNSYIAACIEKDCALSSFDEIENKLEELKSMISDIGFESEKRLERVDVHRLSRFTYRRKRTTNLGSVYSYDIDEEGAETPSIIDSFLKNQDIKYAYD